MGEKFKLVSDRYSQCLQTYQDSLNNVDIAPDIEGMSKCSGLIVNEYVDRANQLANLINRYKELLNKDCSEMRDIVNDVMQQERSWGQSISNSTAH